VSVLATNEFVHAAVAIPVLYIQIAIGIEAQPVRGCGDACLPCLFWHAVVGPVRLVWIVAEHTEPLVVAIEQRDATLEFSDGNQLLATGTRPEGNATWSTQTSHRRVNMRSFEREALKPAVLAVADDKQRLTARCIYCHAVTCLKLACVTAWSTKCLAVLQVWAKNMHPIATVAVGNIDATIISNRNSRWVIGVWVVVVLARLHRHAERPNMRAVKSEFDNLLATQVGAVQVGRAVLNSKLHVVEPRESFGHVSDRIAIRIMHERAVGSVCIDVHEAVRRNRDRSVRIADRQIFVLAPIGRRCPGDTGNLLSDRSCTTHHEHHARKTL
jgi:hypothetical protein